MRVYFASDLHVDVRSGASSTARLARWVCDRARPEDVLVLGGDYGDTDEAIAACLEAFEGFLGPRLAIAGNHDVWARGEDVDSRTRYEGLTGVFERAGFHALEREAFIHGGVGFVGAMGWYDYSFREPSLQIPLEVYHAKSMPGVAGPVWADGEYVDWGVTDPQFTTEQVRALRGQLESLEGVDEIVAVTHHVPVRALLRPQELDPSVHRRDVVPRKWLILNTYLGSQRLGELILRHAERVQVALCGHIHLPRMAQRGGVRFISNGSDYATKELIVYEGGRITRQRFEPEPLT